MPGYDILRAFELMHQGKMNGYFCQGFNPLLSFPNRKKITAALSKLKFLVVMDPLRDRDGAVLGEPRRAQRRRHRADPDRGHSSCRRPALPRTTGSLANSGRWLQWHWAGGTPPGEAKSDIWIMAQIYLRLKALYEKEGGAVPEPILNLDWRYKDPGRADAGRARQGDQRLGARGRHRPERSDQDRSCRRASRSSSFAALRDDGKTACGCWIYSGCFNEAGNNMARRDNSDPDDTGAFPKWAWSWPANRRILYNRASADIDGKPWDPSRKLI